MFITSLLGRQKIKTLIFYCQQLSMAINSKTPHLPVKPSAASYLLPSRLISSLLFLQTAESCRHCKSLQDELQVFCLCLFRTSCKTHQLFLQIICDNLNLHFVRLRVMGGRPNFLSPEGVDGRTKNRRQKVQLSQSVSQ